jgi:hypothetical protein
METTVIYNVSPLNKAQKRGLVLFFGLTFFVVFPTKTRK